MRTHTVNHHPHPAHVIHCRKSYIQNTHPYSYSPSCLTSMYRCQYIRTRSSLVLHSHPPRQAISKCVFDFTSIIQLFTRLISQELQEDIVEKFPPLSGGLHLSVEKLLQQFRSTSRRGGAILQTKRSDMWGEIDCRYSISLKEMMRVSTHLNTFDFMTNGVNTVDDTCFNLCFTHVGQ